MAKKTGEKADIILQAAKEVFAEVGYHGASVSRIAKSAGIGDGTVYLYFKNKEDILTTLFHESIYNQYLPMLEENLSYYSDVRMLLFEIVRSHLSFFYEDAALSRVVQIESRQPGEEFRATIKTSVKREFKIIESVILKGQEDGVFRKDISAKNARKLIFGTLDEMVTSWVLSTREYSLLTMIEPAYKMFLQALIQLPMDGILWVNHKHE